MNTSTIVQLLKQIAAESTSAAASLPQSVLYQVGCRLKRLPALEDKGTLHYRINEIEISLQDLARLRAEIASLARVNQIAVGAAPEVIQLIDLDGTHGVLIKRYRVNEGERLLSVTSTRGPFRVEACERFRTDIERLHAHGLFHPYARGTLHMLVGEETGTLFLQDWDALQTLPSDHDGAELLERLDSSFASRRESGTRFRRINRVEERFGSWRDHPAKVLLPVIHPIGWDEALAAIRVAEQAKVRGIFLINQGMGIEELLRLIADVRTRNRSLWIGVNFLGRTPVEAFDLARKHDINGVWTDDAGIDETAATQPTATDALAARRQWSLDGLYFGGVAFKYQRAVPDERLGEAAALASSYMDVVCTSGPGTGKAADVSKVAAMRAALGPGAALALASGVTVDNVSAYLPYVDAFLVGTGLESRFGVLDPAKVAALREAIETRPPRVTVQASQ